MIECLICAETALIELIDFGKFPVCSKFSKNTATYTFRIGQCTSCGLVQLLDFIPSDELTAIYDWVCYKEPEDHLDELTDIITTKYFRNKSTSVVGLTDKDATLINRFFNKGFSNTLNLKKTDLGINNKLQGIETIQECFTDETLDNLLKRFGKTDLLMARHIFEHTRNPGLFLASMFKLIKDDGLLLIEIPDYSTAFKNFDYSTLWEEHTMYFTHNSIVNSLIILGYEIVFTKIYKYTHENCIALLIKNKYHKYTNKIKPENDIALLANYKANYPKIRSAFVENIKKIKDKSKKIALYGTGHNATMFLNLMGINYIIDLVIDDDLNKINNTLPNTKLSIKDSSNLYSKNIDVCILAVSTESETEIRRKHSNFTDSGGSFLSIYSNNFFDNVSLLSG